MHGGLGAAGAGTWCARGAAGRFRVTVGGGAGVSRLRAAGSRRVFRVAALAGSWPAAARSDPSEP